MNRKPAFSNHFYPNDSQELTQMFTEFNDFLEENLQDKELLVSTPRAVISPHAGYVYSGFTANIAHRILANTKAKRIIVFGPAHHVDFEGIRASFFKQYVTPFGNLNIDQEYISKLQGLFPIDTYAEKVLEHSTETQFPFLKYYQSDVQVVELIYGKFDSDNLAKILSFILQDDDNAVVISTDLSHFHNIDEASSIDSECLRGISELNIEHINNSEACGKIGIKAIVKAAPIVGLKPTILDYRTSAEVNQDDKSVVGYTSVAFYK